MDDSMGNVKYNKIVGTGGIGKGMLFHSDEMTTLGRSESRLVRLSGAKDYCKQHIVLHYAAALLRGQTAIYPIGYVGCDEIGHKLIDKMERSGMNVRFVGKSETESTMLSICLQYPDKEGCNFTAKNNAALHVTPEYIKNCMECLDIDENTIVAVIPEGPVESRLAMLAYGKEKGAYCVLSVPAAEAGEFIRQKAFSSCDLLAVNEEEAAAILGEELEQKELAERLYLKLVKENPNIELLLTCGKKGAYSVTRSLIEHIPPLSSRTVNTTGAGDAFLGGTLAGIAMGLTLQKGREDAVFGETKLSSAAELGTLCAGMAVESEDSIASHVGYETVCQKISDEGMESEAWFIK